MPKISVVIVCKNEESHIGRCLQSLHGLTDDVVVLDNGSTDNTKNIVRASGVRLIEESWEGFGKTKNKATRFAKYDWILNLDADESIDEQLKNSLLALPLVDDTEVFEIKFKNFLGEKYLRFGEWGRDKHIRLFNRTHVNWNQAIVHESLSLPAGVKINRIQGYVLHYTANDAAELARKMLDYALLNAEKYSEQGKKSSRLNVYFAPMFSFIKYYILRFGFADGLPGFICARMSSYYTFVKYARLLELNKKKKGEGRK
ncbi:MAG TPA: glycosyltransferase family 2 protein [Chitinophagaceae bacterium]|nr:glycosyltransferase family 2 protein [Chitinophagaceae bacterium]